MPDTKIKGPRSHYKPEFTKRQGAEASRLEGP
jgi:hypothetical protein